MFRYRYCVSVFLIDNLKKFLLKGIITSCSDKDFVRLNLVCKPIKARLRNNYYLDRFKCHILDLLLKL